MIEMTPIMAGQPVTEPQKFTAHTLIGDPALIPAVPFHLDHSETSPITSKTADKRKSLRARMAPLFCLERHRIANSSDCPVARGTVH